ncbi:hypothetical protein [Pseudozobellia sp. WGM2]|uniref:hypothetical protein n=1 Tax=Pseudozobellia sp. WGM2 TaxID=2787625 RepID=UPI001ADF6CDE|nr:hypothetical protein [Pseudozobellia sp. WGM2]
MSQELLKLAFEKARKEIGSKKKTHLARHLSDLFLENYKYPINERTLRDYYNKLENNDFGKQDDLKPKLVECLCLYLGYNNYAEFVGDNQNKPKSAVGKLGGKTINQTKRSNSFKPKALMFLGIGAVLIVAIIVWSSTKENDTSEIHLECMTWADSLYIKYPCNKRPYSEEGNKIVPFNEHLYNNMNKVTVSASYNFFNQKEQPLVWYYKLDDSQVEFYTSPGLHPVHGKTLKAVTKYIIEKYVPVHQPSKNSFAE